VKEKMLNLQCIIDESVILEENSV